MSSEPNRDLPEKEANPFREYLQPSPKLDEPDPVIADDEQKGSASSNQATTVATDSSTPVATGGNWLHPTSIMFDAISNGRQNLLPAIIALFGAAQGGTFGIFLAIFIFGGTLLVSILRYLTLRYKIDNGELTVKEGLVFKRVRTVPLERIQNIDSTQNLLHRMLGVAEVRVETAAGKEPEAKLRVLSLDKISRLRNSVFGSRTNRRSATSNPDPGTISDPDVVAPPVTEVIHTISIEDLVRAGVASNRGILVFGFLLGLAFQFDLHERLDLNRLFDLLPADMGFVSTAVTAFAGGMLLFVATRVYGAVWYLMRFAGYRLTKEGDDFRISCGLFTKVTATVPQQRIQFISVHRPLFLRMFRLASIRIETAGGSAQENEDATSSVGRRWFIPVIHQDKVNWMLERLRPGMNWTPDKINWVAVHRNTGKRLCRIAVILAMLVSTIGLAVSLTWGWIAGLVVLPRVHLSGPSSQPSHALRGNGIRGCLSQRAVQP